MNGALTLYGSLAYVGSNTDSVDHQDAGVLILDLSIPEKPMVIGQIGPPDEGLPGMESRELRAIPDLEILLVMNIACDRTIGGCTRDFERYPSTDGAAEPDNFKVYDISDPLHPRLISTYVFDRDEFPLRGPHEFFLWRDPDESRRHLIFVSTPKLGPNLEVLELDEPDGTLVRLALFDPELGDGNPLEDHLHSLSVSDDGTVGYLAYWGAGFLMIDTASLAGHGSEIRLLTPLGSRFDPSPPSPPAMHSAVKLPNREIVLVTDEVYPAPVGAGCPGGWIRLLDLSDPATPREIGAYKLAENDPIACEDPTIARKTYSPHNPTVTEHLALVTWHAAGLQIVDTADPAEPKLLAAFVPDPIPEVSRQSPALPDDQVLAYSYPIIKDGLIYFADQRNGLFIVRYTGPYQEELVDPLIEGNSNL